MPSVHATSSWPLSGLGVVVTANCNMRCRYCYQDRKLGAAMPWGVLRQALDLLIAGGQRSCSLSLLGGEPLLEYALVRRAMSYISRRAPGLRVVPYLTTNGTLLNDHRLEALLREGFNLVVSMDGTAEAHRYRSASSHARVVRLLSWLNDRHGTAFKPRVSVNVVVYRPAMDHLADSIAYLLQTGVGEIRLGAAMGGHGWRLEDIHRLDRQFARIHELSLRRYEETGEVPVTWFRRTAEDWPGSPARFCCGVAECRRPVVDVDGRVYPCVMLIRSSQTVARPDLDRFLAQLSPGHIADPELAAGVAKLRETAEAARIFARQDLKWSSYGKCSDCPSVGACSICPVQSAKDPCVHDPLQVSDSLCAFNRVAFEHRRRFPIQPADSYPEARLG